MEARDILEHVKESETFKEWRKDHNDEHLAHIFIMFDGDNLMDKQVGYYNASENTMASFTVGQDGVTLIPGAEVFKKPGSDTVGELDMTSVSIEFDSASEKAEQVLKDKYSLTPTKKIYLLQKIDGTQVWNITYLTNDYSTVNIRIDSSTGDVVKDEKVNIIDFQK